MNHPITNHARGSAHPLLIAAAIAVILFCSVGVAAIMGWIPNSTGGSTNHLVRDGAPNGAYVEPVSQVPPSALVQQSAPMQVAQVAPQTDYVPERAYEREAPAPAPRVVERKRVVAAAPPAKKWCSNCGNVESIRKVTTRARGTGVGAAGGAVIGGLLGSQIGGGRGKDIATAAGAVGGAVIGNQVEGNMKATTSYEIRVRLDDGTVRTFHRETAPPWRNGERVRIVNGGLRSIN